MIICLGMGRSRTLINPAALMGDIYHDRRQALQRSAGPADNKYGQNKENVFRLGIRFHEDIVHSLKICHGCKVMGHELNPWNEMVGLDTDPTGELPVVIAVRGLTK